LCSGLKFYDKCLGPRRFILIFPVFFFTALLTNSCKRNVTFRSCAGGHWENVLFTLVFVTVEFEPITSVQRCAWARQNTTLPNPKNKLFCL